MKGQWFLISAVIVSGIFVVISFLLRDYFGVPATLTNEEHIYFDNVKNGSIRTIHLDCAKQVPPLLTLLNRENLTEYIHFAGQRLAALGYLLNITPKSTLVCSQDMDNFHVIMLKSDKAAVWEGTWPNITSISGITFSGGELDQYTIQFQNPVDYDFFVNASVYDADSFVNSKIQSVPAGSGTATINFALPDLHIPQTAGMYTIIYSTHLIGRNRFGIS